MFAILVGKEIVQTMLDLRFVIATLLFAVLIPLGMYVSRKDYEQRLAAYHREHQMYRQRYGKKAAWDVEAQGFRSPSLLSIFASGVDPFMPDKVVTSRSGLFGTVREPSSDNPHSLLFGQADFLFSITFIVSLGALIFTFNSISGERENGTLRLMIANSVPRSRILFSKVVGNYVALLIPFIVSVLIALLVLDASSDVSIGSLHVWPALLAMLTVTLLFILGVVSLGICVSTFTERSVGSIVLAFFVWVMLVLGVPKVSPMIAEILYPVEGRNVVRLTKRAALEDIEEEFDQKRRELYDKCRKDCGALKSDPRWTKAVQQAEAKFKKEVIPVDQECQRQIADTLKSIEQDYTNRRNRQFSIGMNLSRVSPVSCYSYVTSGLAGTGVTEPDNFNRNAQRYQDQVKEAIYDDITQKKALIPDMTYSYPSVTQALQESWPDVLLLCLFAVLFPSVALARLNKYDVR